VYGLPTELLEEWVARWRRFDWRRAEREVNRFEHFRAKVAGTPLHFVRRRGVGTDAAPLLLVHGWPWTFWDLHETVDPLADPGAHGGDPGRRVRRRGRVAARYNVLAPGRT
jgi:Epoxide hydrolase N terminus